MPTHTRLKLGCIRAQGFNQRKQPLIHAFMHRRFELQLPHQGGEQSQDIGGIDDMPNYKPLIRCLRHSSDYTCY
ncbi:MAG: hypothetical protein ABFS39_11085 [Pseudomonadota bacterium]